MLGKAQFLSFFSLVIFVASPLFANAKSPYPQCSCLSMLKESVFKSTEKTLWLFDIDDTLIMMIDPALHKMNRIKYKTQANQILDGLTADHSILFAHIALQQTTNKLICKKSVKVISELQSRGIPVLGFTAAYGAKLGFNPIYLLRNQTLQTNGIHFENSLEKNPHIVLDEFNEFHGAYPELRDGIIYAGSYRNGHNKGNVLIPIIKELRLDVEEIYFVDDQIENLEDVRKALKVQFPKIKFHGIQFVQKYKVIPYISEKQFVKSWQEIAVTVKTLYPTTKLYMTKG